MTNEVQWVETRTSTRGILDYELSVKQATSLKACVTYYFVIREYPLMENRLNVVNLMKKNLTPVNLDSKRIGNLLDH